MSAAVAVEASPFIRARSNLDALGLHEMAASLGDYVGMVSSGERGFAEAMEEMTRTEVTARAARIVRQRVRSSGFPYVKTLEDFDWSFQPTVPRARVEELATLGFVERAENVVLVGSPGVGKTHLAVAIGIEASLIANTNRVGVVTTGMGSNHLLGAALVQLAVLGDVVMVADTRPAL